MQNNIKFLDDHYACSKKAIGQTEPDAEEIEGRNQFLAHYVLSSPNSKSDPVVSNIPLPHY
jgi:hypothetical protein